jgi:spoIIIJ-associated protein
MAEIERTIEATGADVEAATAAGLAELQVDQDAVEIQVLDEGSRGVFGLGAREARVRLTVKSQPAPPAPSAPPPPLPAEPEWMPAPAGKDEAETGQSALLELLALMGMEDVQIEVRRAKVAPGEKESPLVLNVRGPDIDVLIGRRGETLAALQHIARLIVGQETASRTNLVVDVDGFKVRRQQALEHLAQRLAEQAIRTNRRVVLEPMPPNERRIIHLTLRDHPSVTTESIGQGNRRKVTIVPRHQ